jgi:hypothetical protein
MDASFPPILNRHDWDTRSGNGKAIRDRGFHSVRRPLRCLLVGAEKTPPQPARFHVGLQSLDLRQYANQFRQLNPMPRMRDTSTPANLGGRASPQTRCRDYGRYRYFREQRVDFVQMISFLCKRT